MKARLEFNPRHDLVVRLAELKGEDEELAGKVARQLADNALLAAGLERNPSGVVAGMNELVGELVKK